MLDEKDYYRLTSEQALATAYRNDQRIKDAIKIFEHVVEVRKETLDEKDRDRLASEQALATAYIDDRRIMDASELLKHVVAIKVDILAKDDPSRQLSISLLQDCVKSLEVDYNSNNN
ncbi:hypothetical protein FOWG_01717 [Fusarium oxysporum f. sp. lycopersici MN25]|nr:hypothetical protein FOWG_01717 [Fusarium oxysporum f. sp. lycopersici MN25]